MVQALIGQMLYADPVVYDWAHIQVPTLAFGGAEDMLLGPAAQFQERMEFLARTIPNGNGRVLLLPGLGHVPHLEAADKVLPPLVAVPEGRTDGEVASWAAAAPQDIRAWLLCADHRGCQHLGRCRRHRLEHRDEQPGLHAS